MEQRDLASGEFLFREGDAARSVALVLSGHVEVRKRVNGHTVVLGEVGPGEFVGEMAVLEGKLRSASVRAAGPVRVELFEREEFFRRLSSDTTTALQALLRMSERLRAVNERLVSLDEGSPGPQDEDVPPSEDSSRAPPGRRADAPARGATLRLLPGSERVAAALEAEGRDLARLPFRVGRPTGRRERSPRSEIHLKVPDKSPYRLSRHHFTILEEGGQVAVRDEGSHLGTLVDGAMIGQHASRSVATLGKGAHTIVAGGRDSPFVFRLVVG